MTQFGSSRGMISQNLSQTVDGQGNPIISTDTTFGASPLGYAPLVQSLFGLPNATFQLTPPNTASPISSNNPLPYWDLVEDSESQMSGSAIYDTTTGTWGVNLSPGTAATASTLTFTTRSFLVNDDNLALRQKALAVVSKVGTYAGTSQWNMKLTASYYDHNDALLHSGTVATIYDNTTWTSMSGTTTTGGTAINAAAVYVDLAFVMTTTAAVTSATSVTIKSALLQTSSGAGGGSQSFLVTETFTSSQTWTVPTGVSNLVAVLAIGAGQGGKPGNAVLQGGISVTATSQASTLGKGGDLVLARDIALGTATSVSVSIGAGGAGGTGVSQNKPANTAGTAAVSFTYNPGNASNGGNSSFGSLVVAAGGGNNSSSTASYSTTWGASVFTQSGAVQTIPGGTATTTSFPYYPYAFSQAGTSGIGSYTVAQIGTANVNSQEGSTIGTAGAPGTAGILGAGGVTGAFSATSASGTAYSSTGTTTGNTGSSGGDGAAGGAGGVALRSVVQGDEVGKAYSITAGSAGQISGSAKGVGGAGGGGIAFAMRGTGLGANAEGFRRSSITVTIPSATSGSDGLVVIAYVA